MKLKQIISGALAFAITANSMSFLNSSLSASAESREAWTGYDKPVSFDEWDGTYDTSWFTENAGTKEDPYIIDSAEAFMGIQKKTATANAASVSQATVNNISFLGELDYCAGGKRTALLKKGAVQETKNWYTYTWSAIKPTCNVTYTYDTQDIILGSTESKHYYITSVQLNVTINGITKTIDVTDIARQSVLNPEQNTLFNPLDETLYSSGTMAGINGGYSYLNIYDAVSDLDREINKFKSSWKFTAPVEEGKVYAYTSSHENEFNAEEAPFLLIGETSEFNISFPSVTATNGYGDTITIDASNKDKYYLNVSSGTTISAIATNTPITDTTPSVSLGTKTQRATFVDTSLDDAVSAGEYPVYTEVTDMETNDITLVHRESNTYYYWQTADSDLRFDKDPHYYYVKSNDVGTYNETICYSYGCKVTLTYNVITMEMSCKLAMTCKDKNGNVVKSWNKVQTFTGYPPTYFYNDFYIRASYSNGIVTFTPYLKLGYKHATSGKLYTQYVDLDEFTDSTPATDIVEVSDFDGVTLTDEAGNTYAYEDIAADLKFVGKSKVSPTAHLNIVKRNIYLEDTLPSLVAGNDNPNPTFEGKHFKLTTDILVDGTDVEPVFPYCASGELGTAGMSADFDLNGHVLSTGFATFGNITEKGKLHNGVITSERKSISGVISENFGTIEDVSFIGHNAFIASDSNSGEVIFVQNNYGSISDVDFITCDHATLCSSNSGNITNVDMLAVTPANVGYDYSLGELVYTNAGVLRNVTVDADADVYDLNGCSLYAFIYVNSGIVDNFEVKDFEIINGKANNHFAPIFQTTANTLYNDVTFSYSDKTVDKWFMLPQSSSAGNIQFNNLKITGYHSVGTFAPSTPSSGAIKFVNADIDVTLNKDVSTFNTLLSGIFVDSNISIKYDGELTNVNGIDYRTDLINTDFYISHAYNNNNGYFYGWLQDSNIRIGTLKGTPLMRGMSSTKVSGMKNCVVDVDKAVDIGENYSYTYYWLTNHYGNVNVSFYDTDIIYRSVSGAVPYNGTGGYLKECRVWFNFTDETTYAFSETRNSSASYYDDCEFYFTFDDTASGEIPAFLSGGMAKDVFIYVDEMPDNLCVNDANLTGLATNLTNVTVIAPKVNVHPEITRFAVYGDIYRKNSEVYNMSSGNGANTNLIAVANVFVPENAALESVSGNYISNSYLHNNAYNVYPVIHGVNAMLNVYDKSGNDADIPAFGVVCEDYYYSGRINNVIFRSNSKSPYSALFGVPADVTKYMVEGTYTSPLFWNCFLDLPNANTEGTPSENAEFATAGFIGIAENDNWGDYDTVSDANRYLASALYYNKKADFSRCYIPEGQSAVSTYFTSDGSVKDSWGLTEDYDTLAEGINEVTEEAYTNGELAYLLDKGYAGARRTYNWSVVDPDTVICNSFTNEPLYTLPEITWSATHAIPDRCFADEVNLKPVFKTTVTEAQDGYIKAVGIGGSETTNGNVYVKQGAYVVEEAKPTTDEVTLIYATQKLGDAVPVKIPNTPRSSAYSLRARSNTSDYDITGYTQQGIDTVLTPVFKTARYISVDITNPENGTVIPSAYVSAAGEKITVSIQSETGYIVNNIKINGQPLTDSFFFMPDEDVLITGECVPFEGGISSFSLFGIAGEIDQIAKTITVNVPKSQYVNNALPVIEYYGDYIVPSASTRTDFTNPVDYTVYYGDNQSVTYKVTVNQSEYTMKIYDFVINGVHGKIDQANKTISIGLPAETDLRNLVPEDIAYSAETISPAVDEARDFTVDQIYTLYTTGMTPVNYVVSVHSADEDTAKLTKFVVSGYEGVIDDENLTVTLTVPEGLDLTNVVPDLIEYEGKKISPSKVTAVDLNDAEYDITSQSGVVNTYTIKVNYISDDEAHIDRFVLAGEEGVIDEDEKTITVTISKSKNITGVVPDVIEYTGKSIYPSDDDEQDFTLPVTYTVVAPDNTEVEYEVVIDWLENKADLLEFAILGYEGVIDQENKTVAVTIPYGIDVTDTPPSKLVVSTNANVTPTIVEHQNFTNPVVYTVVSQDRTVTNDYTVNVTIERPSTIAEITEFKIDEYEGVIDQDDGIITVTLPFDYPTEELENKIPEIVWSGKDIAPDDDEAQDFTKPIEYIVTAEDPDVKKDYDVIIKYEEAPYVPDKRAEITEFKIDEYEGEIDPDKGTITVTLPYDYPEEELKDKVPEIKWIGKDITPDDDKPQNFTEPVTYTVTAEDPTITKDYDVIIKYADKPVVPSEPDKTAKITEFKIDEYEGEIDDEDGIITVTLPFDYPEDELKDKIPEIKWIGEDITPDEDAPQDFTKPVEYTVTAEDPSVKKEYDIVIKYEDPDDTAKITKFKIDEYEGVIDQEKGVITIIVPHNYPDSELENKVPYIEWIGKTITPDENEAQDFTKPLEYTVTAQNPDIFKTYDIVVKHADKPVIPSEPVKDKEAKIIEFWIDEYEAEIDQEKGEIIITLPHDYPVEELKNKVPEIVWVGEDIDPDENEAQDFTKSLEYTVTAEDPSIKKTYDIIVEFAPEDKPDVEEIPEDDEEEDIPADEEDDTPVIEDDPIDEDDEDEDEEEEEDIPDEDTPVPTGIVLNLIPFAVSAITVVITGKAGKKKENK